MSLRRSIISGLTLALALGIFAVAGSAQTPGEAKREGVKKAERMEGKAGKRGFARGMRGAKFGHKGGMHGLRGIELTEAQKVQINAIREANKPDAGMREEMRSLMQARRAGTVTEDQTARVQTLRAQQREKMESVRFQIEAILTPDQKQQIETRKQEMKQRMELRRQETDKRRQEWQQKRQSGEKPADN
jgi:periplasmic protein CpxP/Spy